MESVVYLSPVGRGLPADDCRERGCVVRPATIMYVDCSDDDDDWDAAADQVSGAGGLVPYAAQERQGLVRRSGPTFIAAQPARQPPATVDAPAWLVERQAMPLEGAWTALEGAQEHTSAMDRAKALRVRLVPFLATWGLVALVVGVIVALVAKQWPAGALVTLLLFALLTAVTYYRLNRTDYEYSREGTERHKIDVAADLARRNMAHEHELRRMALETYLRTLEQHEGGRR